MKTTTRNTTSKTIKKQCKIILKNSLVGAYYGTNLKNNAKFRLFLQNYFAYLIRFIARVAVRLKFIKIIFIKGIDFYIIVYYNGFNKTAKLLSLY